MLSDTYLLNWGRFVLVSALSFGLLITVYLTALAPDLIPFLPIALVGGIGLWTLFHFPLVNLAVVMASFVLIADFEEGIQASEVLYGLYYLGFLGHWFLTRLVLGGANVMKRREDQLLLVFLVLMTLSAPLTLLFGGSMKGVLGEWLSFAMLGFYFPVREAIERHRHGLKVVVGAVLFVGLFIFMRNLLNFQEIVLNASQAWQVAKGRAVTNESLLLVPAFFTLVLFLFSETLRDRTVWAGAFIMFLSGLILTQSRGYWVAFAFGAIVLFMMVPGKYRSRMVLSGVLAAGGAFAIGYILFADVLILILTGLLDRLTSIGSATSKDISLINRVLESSAALTHVAWNPILGHGMGTPFRFYDITWEYSMNRAFIHNGYVSLVFKFGIWGTALLLGFFGLVAKRSWGIARDASSQTLVRICALAVIGCLASFLVSSNTSNPFYMNDSMFILSVLCGIAAGCVSRAQAP